MLRVQEHWIYRAKVWARSSRATTVNDDRCLSITVMGNKCITAYQLSRELWQTHAVWSRSRDLEEKKISLFNDTHFIIT